MEATNRGLRRVSPTVLVLGKIWLEYKAPGPVTDEQQTAEQSHVRPQQPHTGTRREGQLRAVETSSGFGSSGLRPLPSKVSDFPN